MLQINEKSPTCLGPKDFNFRKVPLPNLSFKQKWSTIYWSLLPRKRPNEYPIIKCYSNRCVQNAECRLHTGGVGLSFLDRLIFLHSWWESNENFLGAASVIISRPATCQASMAGEHFSAAKLVNGIEVVLCWKLLLSTRAWHPIRFST